MTERVRLGQARAEAEARIAREKATKNVSGRPLQPGTIGDDGKPQGYFESMAMQQPKLFAALLGRVLACQADYSVKSETSGLEWTVKYVLSETDFHL